MDNLSSLCRTPRLPLSTHLPPVIISKLQSVHARACVCVWLVFKAVWGHVTTVLCLDTPLAVWQANAGRPRELSVSCPGGPYRLTVTNWYNLCIHLPLLNTEEEGKKVVMWELKSEIWYNIMMAWVQLWCYLPCLISWYSVTRNLDQLWFGLQFLMGLKNETVCTHFFSQHPLPIRTVPLLKESKL